MKYTAIVHIYMLVCVVNAGGPAERSFLSFLLFSEGGEMARTETRFVHDDDGPNVHRRDFSQRCLEQLLRV